MAATAASPACGFNTLPPPPLRRLPASSLLPLPWAPPAAPPKPGYRVARSTIVRAIAQDDTSTSDVPEIVKSLQDAWDKVEDKYAVSAVGFAFVVALWGATGVISAIDRLPLVPGVLELVGIGYSAWFAYRNLIFKPDREALFDSVKSTYNNILGSATAESKLGFEEAEDE